MVCGTKPLKVEGRRSKEGWSRLEIASSPSPDPSMCQQDDILTTPTHAALRVIFEKAYNRSDVERKARRR